MAGIQILPPQEARRIAAGEVIDRPAALIRELVDNAIDAGACDIEVSIEEGGSKKVEVADNGSGMGRDDLLLCAHAHATSKIRCLDDLAVAETLGFRGEALAAAAAVSRLEIVSSINKNDAWRFTVGPGEINPPSIERANRTKGSTVRALGLFDTVPARKQFLKREGSEAALCHQVFIEKALAFPEITFRFTQDGRPKVFLPAASSKKDRFAAALLDPQEGNFLHEIHVSGSGFSAEVVIGGPDLFRADRRMLHVFANGRRIQDYSLITAMEYGAQGWFPNGTHPVGAVYVDIDPALADFNIHPAKREARFRDPGAIHHAVSSGLRDFCRRLYLKTDAPPERAQAQMDGAASQGALPLAMEALFDKPSVPVFNFSNSPAAPAVKIHDLNDISSVISPGADGAAVAAEASPRYGELRYVGRIFGVFILAEYGDRLFIIDQHAAHERVLYDRFLAEPIPQQELLIPIVFTAETEEDSRFLETKKEVLAKLAIVIEKDGDGWQINALPQLWRLGDAETVREILALRTADENIAERWAATLCCHQAVRDGDYLDDTAALALAEQALALPVPRCPHGRPIWTEITRDALYRAVRRT